MKIRIKTYNGELPSYLTKGEDYSQVGVDHNYPDIIDDDGDDTFDDQIYKMTNGEDFDDQFVQDWFDHFKAGQQSQQVKIDCMQVRLDGANERALSILNHKNVMVDKMQAEIDELQGRIDRVAHILTYTNHASTPLCNELRDILKGNKDEN